MRFCMSEETERKLKEFDSNSEYRRLCDNRVTADHVYLETMEKAKQVRRIAELELEKFYKTEGCKNWIKERKKLVKGNNEEV